MTPPLSNDMKDKLHEIYYTDKQLFGRDRLFEIIKEKDLPISRRQIMQWLKHQQVHQLTQKTKKVSKVQSTILKAPFQQIGIDLIDMNKLKFNNYRYILTAVDLFSKYAWVLPMKNKNETLKYLKQMIDSMPKKPASIRSDNGTEFKNRDVANYLKGERITQIFSLSYTPQSNGQVERFNGTLKRLIKKNILIDNNKNWVGMLNLLVKNYNNSKQTTTKHTPEEIINGNEELFKKVEENIRKKVTKGQRIDKVVLKVGDSVRVKFGQRDRSGLAWSEDIYKIYKIVPPKDIIRKTVYRLKDKDNRTMSQHYYAHELQKVTEHVENNVQNDRWDVERLIKPTIHNGVASFFVKWSGFPHSANTIEPRSNLIEDIPHIVRQFEESKGIEWYSNNTRFKYNT